MATSLRETNRRWPADRLVGHMRMDKKAENGSLTFILTRGIGQAFVSRDVAEADLRAFLAEEGAA